MFAVLFGLATSLGLGAQQALAGLHHLYGIEINAQNKIILMIVISAIALGSVVAGIEAGVKRLSELNVALALLLMLLIIAVGPTADILQGLLDNTAAYLRYLPQLSQPFGRDDNAFLQGWTSFYWAWWISWSPFVGMFIARISKGRSVRQFLVCVLIAPTLVSIFWMTTFGGTALHQLVAQGYTGVQEMVLANQPELSLFMMLRQLPWAGLTSLVAIVLVVIFFVTSSDSGSLVIDGITAGGKVDAPIVQRIFWAVAQGVVALILLLGGGLNSLQAASVATGFPFLFVLLLMMLSTWRVLRWCHRAERRAVSRRRVEAASGPARRAAHRGSTGKADPFLCRWRRRLEQEFLQAGDLAFLEDAVLVGHHGGWRQAQLAPHLLGGMAAPQQAGHLDLSVKTPKPSFGPGACRFDRAAQFAMTPAQRDQQRRAAAQQILHAGAVPSREIQVDVADAIVARADDRDLAGEARPLEQQAPVFGIGNTLGTERLDDQVFRTAPLSRHAAEHLVIGVTAIEAAVDIEVGRPLDHGLIQQAGGRTLAQSAGPVVAQVGDVVGAHQIAQPRQQGGMKGRAAQAGDHGTAHCPPSARANA